MSVAATFSSRQLHGLHRLLTILSSPLAFASADVWRDEAVDSMRDLFQAEMGLFALTVEGESPARQTGYDESDLRDYVEYYGPRDPFLPSIRARGKTWVTTASSRHADPEGYDAYLRGEVFNEFYRRVHGFVGAAVLSNTHGGILDGLLSVMGPDQSAEEFGDWGATVLQLVQPVFAGAVRTFRAFEQHRADLGRYADAIGRPFVAYDGAGVLLHQNSALSTLLADEPGRDAVMRATRLLATAMSRSRVDRSHRTSWQPSPATSTIRPQRRAYALTASHLPAGAFGSVSGVVVTVERAGRMQADTADRQLAQLRLTKREAEVARLLITRYSTEEIATSLGVSAHTARHHIEHVYRKAQVSGRVELRAVLLGAGREGTARQRAT